uniref:Guanylate cyclase domain-containing protein n=1 Tax=Aplanochytrium stocchinoi TaxID=215587 RepID=A0A7S3PEK7_9STRA
MAKENKDKLLADILASRSMIEMNTDKFTLSIKFGIATGVVNIIHIGGATDSLDSCRIEYLAVGPALQDAFEAEKMCQEGQVVVTQEAMKAVKNTNFYTFSKIQKQKAFWQVSANEKNKKLHIPQIKTRELNTDQNPEIMFNYVPAAVAPYLEQKKHFESWLSELRRVTTLFCDIGMSGETMDKLTRGDPETENFLQNIYEKIQTLVFKYEGVINKFLIDDKGNTLIVVFGLAPFSHEDDANRAVFCAVDIINFLNSKDLKPAMGVTTSVCYGGVIGHAGSRREYSIIGDGINMAARLMSLAKTANEKVPHNNRQALYIEESTRLSLRDVRLIQEFVRSKEPVKLKGHKEKVWFYKRDLETLRILKTFEFPQFRHNRLATIFVHNDKSKKVSSIRYLIIVKPGQTIGELENMVIQKLNSKEVTTNRNKWALLFYKVTPEESLVAGVRLNEKQLIDEIPRELKILYFEFKEFSGKPPKMEPLLSEAKGRFFTKRLTTIDKPPGFEAEDTFSIIRRLEEAKERANEGLKVMLIEGSYGVGRSFGIKQAIGGSNTKNSVLRVAANPFLGLHNPARYGRVWVDLINQIMDDQLFDLGVGVEDSEKIKKARNNIVKDALKRSQKIFAKASGDKDSKRHDAMQLSILNDLLNTSFRETALTVKKSTIVFGKEDVDAIFSKDTVLSTQGKRGRSMMSRSSSVKSDAGRTQGSEHILRLLSTIFVGLCPDDKSTFVTIDDSHYMDPYSWLVLLELAEYWQTVPVTIILSHRNVEVTEGLKKSREYVDEKAEDAINRIQDSMPFAEDSTAGLFIRSTTAGKGKRPGSKLQNNENIGMLTNTYSAWDQRQDVLCLIEKLRSLEISEFLEVRARPEYTEKIICNVLEVEDPAKAIVNFLREKTKGNPLFIADALKILKERGAIKLNNHGGFTTATIDFDDEAKAAFEKCKHLVPVTAENVTGMVIDKMDVTQQVTLKVAALIPRTEFTLGLIESLSPLEKTEEEMNRAWKGVVRSGIVEEVPGKEGVFTFLNPWVRASIRKRILQKQKEEIKAKFKRFDLVT